MQGTWREAKLRLHDI